MYEVEISTSFSAAHQLKGYPGNCRNLHGHNYSVTVTVSSGVLNEIGIALDFKLLKAAVEEVVSEYDHHNLSELPDFAEINPTSEVVARTLFRKLKKRLESDGIHLARVRVGESDHSAITYFED